MLASPAWEKSKTSPVGLIYTRRHSVNHCWEPGAAAGGSGGDLGSGAPPPPPPSDQAQQAVIDKLAAFVARNGPAFEAIVMRNHASDAHFSFLQGGAGAPYFRWKVRSSPPFPQELSSFMLEKSFCAQHCELHYDSLRLELHSRLKSDQGREHNCCRCSLQPSRMPQLMRETHPFQLVAS